MTMRQGDEGLCCLRAIATVRSLQLAGNDHSQRKKWTQQNLSQKYNDKTAIRLLNDVRLRPGRCGSSGNNPFGHCFKSVRL